MTYIRRPRAKLRLLNYFLLYKISEDQIEDFSRIKMTLHHLFREIERLKTVLDSTEGSETLETRFDSWKEAYEHCIQIHHDHEPDGLESTFEEPDEDDFEKQANLQAMEEELQSTWQAMVRQLPNNLGDRVVDEEQLGFRGIDQYDWSTHVVDSSLSSSWWISQIQANSGEMIVDQASQRLFDTLQGKQRQIFDLVVDYFQKSLNTTELAPSQLLL